MFDAPFDQLFKAVDRVRVQLETATDDLKPYLAQELACLQELGETVIDRWMTLDEHIQDLMDTYGLYNLTVHSSTHTPIEVQMASRTARHSDSPHPSETKTDTHVHHNLHQEDDLQTDMNLAQAVFSWSDQAVVQFRRGLAFYDLLMWDEAISALSQVLTLNPSPVVRLYVAAALAAKGQVYDALAHVREVLRETNDGQLIAAAYEIEAQVWLTEGRIERAAECFEAVTNLTPSSSDAWFNLSLARMKQNELDRACQALYMTVKQSPRDIEAHQLLVSATRAGQGPKAALKVCLEGLNFAPSDKGLRLWKSKLLFELGNAETSKAIADRLADQYPEDSSVTAWSAWISVSEGKTDEAVGLLKKHLTLHRCDGRALLQLGMTYLLAGASKDAEAVLWAALPLSSESALIWLGLSAISFEQKDYASAQKRAIRAIHDERPAIRRLALYQYGRALQGDNRHQEAETYLRAAHLLGQPSAAILDALAESADCLGRPDEAMKRRSQAQHLMLDLM